MPFYLFSCSHLSCYILKILLCSISLLLIEGNVEKELEARTPHDKKVHFENNTLQRLQVSFFSPCSHLHGHLPTPTPPRETLLSQTLADSRASFQLTLHPKFWGPACPSGALPGLYLGRLMKTVRIWA